MKKESVFFVERALDLLAYLGDGKEITFDQAEMLLKLPQQQVQCLARALTNKGFVLQDTQDETLRLGSKVFINFQPKVNSSALTPKGIDGLTLQGVKEKLSELPKDGECTAVELAQIMGITRVTARRYLEFLATEGVVRRRQQYVRVGRPVAKYKIVGCLH